MILWCLGAIICTYSVGVGAIDGGSFVMRKEVPYYVHLVNNGTGFCGASIISRYWVITAAHCIVYADTMRVVTGANVFRDVEKVIVHGYYDDEPKYNNDVALVKLKRPIRFNELQQPIKIKTTPPVNGDVMLVSGFGDQGRSRGPPPVLKTTSMPVVTCDEEEDPRRFICAGVHGSLSCPGDSGGPVVINDELAGLVSHGPYCDEVESDDVVDVFTRLDTYVDWIQSYVTS